MHAVPITCQFITLISHCATFLSTWYCVSLATDRHLVVCCPRLRRTFCTQCRARLVVIGLAVLAVVVYVNTTILVGVVQIERVSICTFLRDFGAVISVLDKLNLLFNTIIPLVTTVILITRIVIEITGRRRRLNFRFRKSGERWRHVLAWSAKSELHLTRAVIIYLAVGWMLQIPQQGHRLYNSVTIMQGGEHPHQPSIICLYIPRIFHFLFVCSFCIKAPVLFLTWPEFRSRCSDAVLLHCVKLRGMFSTVLPVRTPATSSCPNTAMTAFNDARMETGPTEDDPLTHSFPL